MKSVQSSVDMAVALDPKRTALEVWGGVEYTCNRVGDTYFDQMDLSGHTERLQDYEQIVQIGIRTLRVSVLWERYERERSWRWSDEHLHCLRSLGVRPIAGLMHHGSGPPHTSLLDPNFPTELAAYAGAVAERYPWVDAYTPVNEPHTTARFSGRYGIWYPHQMSGMSYLRALCNQLRATVLSMEAIRRIRPDAQLIQTDDLGSISGTEELRPTWEMLNLRQWLPYDLLFGRVDREHPLFEYMRAEGLEDGEILWFADHPCPPDLIGLNYYATSDRYLDHRVKLYPPDRRSAEGDFADVERVRVHPEGLTGLSMLLKRVWQRYRSPLAVTETHLGSTVEEQIRWMCESYHETLAARDHGVNCVALTAWALLGSYYWNELVTRENGHYEPGVFDVSSGVPRPTALAGVVAQMAAGKEPCHPALSEQGWWRRPDRICFPYYSM